MFKYFFKRYNAMNQITMVWSRSNVQIFCTHERGNNALWHMQRGICIFKRRLWKVSQLCIGLLKYYRVLKMELTLPISSKLKRHTVISYFPVLAHTFSDIYAKMKVMYGNSISYDVVKRWHHKFLNGHMETVDELHEGWMSVINEDSINMVRALIEENGSITVAEI